MQYLNAPNLFQNWPRCRGGGGGGAGLSWSGLIGCASVAHRWKAWRTACHPVQSPGDIEQFAESGQAQVSGGVIRMADQIV